jgi:arylsulfatase A-like enzyme
MSRPPNVILFISDQQRADTMPGVRRAPAVQTPHLDWLAARGTLFRNAYCAAPLCTPARAALLSGRYPHQTGMVANNQPRPITEEMRLPPHLPLLADYLRPRGYAAAYTGKWHIGSGGDRRGFSDLVTRSADFDVDGPAQNETLTFGGKVGAAVDANYVRNFDPARYDRRTQVGPALLPLAWHPATRDAQAAAHFVRLMARDRPEGTRHRPFVLGYSCHEPHHPFVSPRPFDRMYAPGDMPLNELVPTLYDPAGPALARTRGERRLKPAWQWSEDDLRAMWAAYYGQVSYVDHLLGIILEALIDTDQLDDTLLVFTSDHGEMLGSHGLVLKGEVMYEELINVPLLVVPPGGLSGPRATRRLVEHTDLLPTILRWCGVAPPPELPGADLRPLIEGAGAAGGDDAAGVPLHEGVAVQYHSTDWGERPVPLRCWRTEDWKYVETAGGRDELYHLAADPLETRNVVDDPACAAAIARLRGELRAWQARTGDAWPTVALPPRFLPPSDARWPDPPPGWPGWSGWPNLPGQASADEHDNAHTRSATSASQR